MATRATPGSGRVTLTLSPEDGALARVIGRRRYRNAVDRGMRDHLAKDSLVNHILGCAGEIVFAHYLGVEWDQSVGKFKKRPDVAGFEVRCRRIKNGYHPYLIVRPDDHDERPFVLVEYEPHTSLFTIVGWLLAADAKIPRWHRSDPPPAWWVAQSALHPFTIAEIDDARRQGREHLGR